MAVIDLNPEVLSQSAAATLHAAEQANIHIAAEIIDEIPGLMDTLVENGPYAYTNAWEMLDAKPGDPMRIPITTTRQGVHDGYVALHQRTAMDSWVSLLEVHGEWYTFVEGAATGYQKPSGQRYERSGATSVALFPVSSGKGITGELVWGRRPRTEAGLPPVTSDEERLALRAEFIEQHDQYLKALRAGDVTGIVETIDDDGQSAIRDYVADTGTLTVLDGVEAHRMFYRALFDKYDIQSADLLHRFAQDWYVFSEVRLTVTTKEGPDEGRTLTFNTAEYFVPGVDGKFVVRIGHGTDPA
jgi:hypothetical protein